jgi:hypothetical protein
MKISAKVALTLLSCFLVDGLLRAVGAQQPPAPPPGYFDIPAGFDFPADKQTLEQYRTSVNVSAQRVHAWNVFAGMTQPTPDGKLAIFETWFPEDDTFQAGEPLALTARRAVPLFRVPNQFREPPGPPAAAAVPQEPLVSLVLYNFAAYNHVRTNRLFQKTVLDGLAQTGAPDPKIPANRTIPPFPANAVSLKTVWWPVAKDRITPMPVWDPETNPLNPDGNPYQNWTRVVAIDPTRSTTTDDDTVPVDFLGKPFPNAHRVGLRSFHLKTVDDQMAAGLNQNSRLGPFIVRLLGRPIQSGDFLAFAGTHLTTKEIDDWVWATFWWHDRPNNGPFAADRPASLKGVWRQYLMNTAYDPNLPRESGGGAHITFNPWLEAKFKQGLVSNCMNCHNRASWPQDISFLPVQRGDPDLKNDRAFASGRLRVDFLWSLFDEAK